jgi:hypothetical protein
MEVIALRGKARDIRELANALLSLKGVKHGKLLLTLPAREIVARKSAAHPPCASQKQTGAPRQMSHHLTVVFPPSSRAFKDFPVGKRVNLDFEGFDIMNRSKIRS